MVVVSPMVSLFMVVVAVDNVGGEEPMHQPRHDLDPQEAEHEPGHHQHAGHLPRVPGVDKVFPRGGKHVVQCREKLSGDTTG